jgi:H+/gluconate symporter-like permease
MMVNANDRSFWVVTEYGKMDVETGYNAHIMGTLALGMTMMTVVFILCIILKAMGRIA